ncbi:VOC family protein [Caldalkalibacillus salinus]|uniref:VOC family protein n=1 Tax=Caldalkalibacillus salinus TaxID=2803787 RepID=UPI001923D394|nr:VOC family protein [Caldalkalibacillus salinus]
MALQADKIFVNLPVKDLEKTKAFYSSVGFAFNPQFSDNKAACMVISDHNYAMLLLEEYFQTYTKKEISDATTSTEAILAITAESREQVDEIVNRALAAGGKHSMDPQDHGFMYGWSFQDLDGHMWEVIYMDESAVHS